MNNFLAKYGLGANFIFVGIRGDNKIRNSFIYNTDNNIGAIKSSRKYIFMSCQIPITPASDVFTVRLCAEKLAIFTLTFPKPVNIKPGFGPPLFMLGNNVNECSFSLIHIEGARIAPCKIVFLY